jgi:hypothetical protein
MMVRLATFYIVVSGALLAACDVETIVAGRPAADAGSKQDASIPDAATPPEAGTGEECREDQDCAANEFCARSACLAPLGTCEVRPSVCGTRAAPECGCDGVTYFNDCLRRTNGMNLQNAGQCGSRPKRCGGPRRQKCDPGESCAMLVRPGFPVPCPPDPPGTCWVVPSVCEEFPGGGDRFNSCNGPPLFCMDACTAIRSEQPHVRSSCAGEGP